MTAIAMTIDPLFTEGGGVSRVRRTRNSDLEISSATVLEISAVRQWKHLQDELNAFAKYSDDWDGMESAAPSSKLIANAFSFLAAVKQINSMLPPTAAILGPNGTIAIEWRSGKAKVQAEISSGHFIDWFETVPGKPFAHWRQLLGRQSTGGDANWTSVEEVEGADVASASAL